MGEQEGSEDEPEIKIEVTSIKQAIVSNAFEFTKEEILQEQLSPKQAAAIAGFEKLDPEMTGMTNLG